MINTNPTPEDVASMPYVELLASISESNMPPGGLETVRKLVQNCHINPTSKVLHAGCNTGFLSKEMTRLSGCTSTGIDISKEMVERASQLARQSQLHGKVAFRQMDMTKMEFADQSFDVTCSGGALAFVKDHRAAISEWIRVTKDWGVIADAELYYDTSPPASTRKAVEEIIGVPLPTYNRDYWLELFGSNQLRSYYKLDAKAGHRDESAVRKYCSSMVDYGAKNWSDDAKEVLRSRLETVFLTFNENLSYMSYVILVYRKLPCNSEPSLYM